MPELPEVETTCKGIEPFIFGKSIHNIIVREARLRWPVPTKILRANLITHQVKNVSRRAKYILIHFSTGTLIVHLGMSGTLRIASKTEALKKHDHVEFVFDDQTILRFNDPRRFGCVLFAKNNEPHALLDKLGPEPLEKSFDGEYLFQKAHKHRAAIKTFIMNQRIVVGVGNIYANEALFLAGIHPNQMANTITLAQHQTLASAIKKVLKAAIKQGGTTLKDFRQSDGKPGYFSQALTIYDREGLACIQCKTFIKAFRLGQRATYFCPSCQKCPSKQLHKQKN